MSWQEAQKNWLDVMRLDDTVYYLDYASSTPPLAEAVQAVREILETDWANPSSQHSRGIKFRKKLEWARHQVAQLLDCSPSDVIFTSGGTEANQLAIWGVLRAVEDNGFKQNRDEIILSSVEHISLLANVERMKKAGWQVRLLPVNGEGRVDPQVLRNAISDKTLLVSVQWVNNEVGTIQPVKELAKISHEAGAFFHSDAVQAASLLEISMRESGVDLLSVSSHKLYGPPGVGALCIRRGVPFRSPLGGGKQERGRRPGTENLPGIAGFAAAAGVVLASRKTWSAKVRILCERLWTGLSQNVEGIVRFSPMKDIHPGILSVGVPATKGEGLVLCLDKEGIMVSSGAACHAGESKPSSVLLAMGIPETLAHSQIRFSLGLGFPEQGIEEVIRRVARVVRQMKG